MESQTVTWHSLLEEASAECTSHAPWAIGAIAGANHKHLSDVRNPEAISVAALAGIRYPIWCESSHLLTRCTTWPMMARRALAGVSLIMPKSRKASLPSGVASRLPGCGSAGPRSTTSQAPICRTGRRSAKQSVLKETFEACSNWTERASPMLRPSVSQSGQPVKGSPKKQGRPVWLRFVVATHLRGRSLPRAAGAGCTGCPC